MSIKIPEQYYMGRRKEMLDNFVSEKIKGTRR